jgi:hypothetical protein
MRSDPSRVGDGRLEVGSGEGTGMMRSSKVNRESGKTSSWLVIRVARVAGMNTTCER